MLQFIQGMEGYLIGGVVLVILLVLLLLNGYVKAPTDKAFIISGLKKKPRIIIGKAAIKIPFFERKDELELQLIQIDVKTSSTVPTADYINVNVDSTVNVKIGSEEGYIDSACENFLNKPVSYISQTAREVLEGNVREIVGKMKLEEMVQDRQKFSELVKENAEPDLKNMGLKLINFNVQNFIDDNGVIENLGVDNIVAIRKNAEISRANAEKDIARAKAEANKDANDARVASERAIAERNNELALKKSELKILEDTKRAEADAAYQIQQEEQRKTVETKTADANIIKQEKEIVIKQREAEIQEQELAATVKKKADANLYESQKNAEADLYRRKKEAEAKKYEYEQEAEAIKIKSEAELQAKKNEAAGIESVGNATAAAKKAELLAEAEGLDKKAEAMQKMQEAAVIQMVVEQLPEIVKNAAEPLSNVKNITMYGEGNGAKLVEDVMTTTSKVINGIEGATGLDVKSLIAGVLGGKIASGKIATGSIPINDIEQEECISNPQPNEN